MFKNRQAGASGVAYGLMVGLIGVAIIASVNSTGSEIASLLQRVDQSLNNVASTSTSTPAKDTTPNSFSFAPTSDAAPSTQTTSNIVAITGHDGVGVTVSGDASAAYRICADAGCSSVVTDWTQAGGSQIADGQYLQLRVTSAALGANMAITAAAGNTSSSWSITSRTEIIPTGTFLWANSVGANGNGSISAIRYQSASISGNTLTIAWPLIQVSGTVYSVHAGCGNQNGIRGCDAICKSIGAKGIHSSWSVPCGTGYPSGASNYANTCVYKTGNSSNNQYVYNYGSTGSCNNPMNNCQCAIN